MKRCAHCGQEFNPSRPNTIYCGGTCKTGAYRSRKRQEKEAKYNKLTPAARADLNFVRQFSETAYGRLMEMRATLGRAAFESALDACFAAVKDTHHSFFSS